MKNFAKKYKNYWTDKKFLVSTTISIIFLITSLVLMFYAGLYAAERASSPVTDIVLSNVRTFDVDGIFVYGFMIFWIFISFLGILEPKKIPFTVKSIALFIIIRSVFISLTHIGPFPTQAVIDSNIVKDFSSGADLFFSAHTGLPFLMALIFWENIYLRSLFVGSSFLFGATVLLGHLHYTIDVLAAFFITYTINHIAETLFKKDKELFDKGL